MAGPPPVRPPEDAWPVEARFAAKLPHFYALRRSWETGEPYWFWKVGRWDVGAGVFKGFGLGFTVQQGEWDLTLGPFSIGGVHE